MEVFIHNFQEMANTEPATEKSTPEKLMKKVYFLSLSSDNICALCTEKITETKRRYRLWKENGEKTDVCLKAEEAYRTTFSKNTDFKIICRNCQRQSENAFNATVAREEQRQKSKNLAKSQFLQYRLKRVDTSTKPDSKKRLIMNSQSTADSHSCVEGLENLQVEIEQT